mgnify:CR=1 FL=1
MKSILSFCLYLGLGAIPLLIYYASFYAPASLDSSFKEIALFYLVAFSVLPLYLLFFLLVFLAPLLRLCRNTLNIVKVFLGFIFLIIPILILAVDAHVFYLYRFHLNLAMLDLFFNGNGQIITFSFGMIVSIVLEVVILFTLVLFVSLVAFIAQRKRNLKFRFTLIPLCICFIAANLCHTYAQATSQTQITSIASRIPLYYPLTANTFLLRHGFIKEEDMLVKKIDYKNSGLFAYPKHPLSYGEVESKLNILIVAVDCLRADMLTDEVMPNLYQFAQKSLNYKNHQSGGNCTRFGIFSLFYGVPGTYWNVARNSATPSALVKACLDFNYDIKTFTSAPLYKPEFHQTVFAGVDGLRMTSVGDSPLSRDLDSLNDFKNYLDTKDPNKKFLSFIFFDSLHEYQFKKDQKKLFTPTEPAFNYLELSPKTELGPYINLCKNASYTADTTLGKLFTLLDDKKLLENTVVIVTGDHGDEFNDNGLNFWGHNSNFTRAQTHVPLVLYIPNIKPQEYESLSLHYDVSPTLLKHVFGVKNNIDDFSVGQDLLSLSERPYYWVSSYNENALVLNDKIAVVDTLGFLTIRDHCYRKTESQEFDAQYYWQAIEQLNAFLKK